MSRILRRPMFRGGRVDSRGTGITSGLSYKKGGRVGFANGGGYKFSETPVAKGLGWLNNEFNKMLAAGYDLGAVPVNTFARMFGYNPGFSGAKWMDTMTMGEFSKMNPEINKDQAWFLNPWGPTSAEEGWTIPSMGGNVPPPTGIKGPPGGGETSRGSGEAYYKAPAKEEKSTEELLKSLMGPKKTAKEKVAEYKEVFEDAYGSGVADDASRMLMSFAGKELKPGADTKSAFGEFFEEESKVEGKRSKYKDAATTAAINAYLTGEKDYDALMKQMKIIDYQIDRKSDAAKEAKKALSFVEIKAGLPQNMKDRERTKAAAELFVQYTDPGKSLTVIEADEETPELLKAPENEGLYFMNRDTKEVFKIVKGIKQLIYGG